MNDTAVMSKAPTHQPSNSGAEARVRTPLQPTRPVYEGTARIISWNESSQGGMWTKLQLLDVGPDELHPFRGLRANRNQGQLLHVRVTAPWLRSMPLYDDEGMLLYWEDTPAGMMVRLAFNDGPGGVTIHPLKGMKAGKQDGEELAVTVWAYDDQNRVVAKQRRRNTQIHMVLSCRRDPDFRRWLMRNRQKLVGEAPLPQPASNDDPGEEYAVEVVRTYCGVDSRSVLNEETERGRRARSLWLDLFHTYENSSRGN